MKILRILASVLMAAALTALLTAFYCAEVLAPMPIEVEAPEPVALGFHDLDRLENAPPWGGASNCLGCHDEAPHSKNKPRRAFLNMHLRILDCSICHLAGGKTEYKMLRKLDPVGDDDVILTSVLKGEEIATHVEVEMGEHKVEAPRTFNSKGIGCKRCHRRGSTMLRALGIYKGYRLRILEDLEVLSDLERQR